MTPEMQSALGLVAIFAFAWAISERRRPLPWSTAALGIAAQAAIALAVLKVPAIRAGLAYVNDGVLALQAATEAGGAFVFGYLAGGPAPFETTAPANNFILAFRVLPLVIVVGALTALLTYWRVLPAFVRALAFVVRRLFRVGGAVGLSAAANIFIGMVESPLLVHAYIARLGRSELFIVMTTGMATIAGTVLVVYAAILGPLVPDAAGHLLTASVISVPAAVALARIMVPETEASPDSGEDDEAIFSDASGAMDAITRGTATGLDLYLRIVAMLIVLVALVHLANAILGLLPDAGGAALSLQRLLGWIMAPAAWLIGVPWAEAGTAGQLLGEKTVLNEFIAYLSLAGLPDEALGERSRLILTYALCGFANFGSLGIMVGGLTAIAPARRADIVALGPRSIVSGTLATLSTGAVVGLVG